MDERDQTLIIGSVMITGMINTPYNYYNQSITKRYRYCQWCDTELGYETTRCPACGGPNKPKEGIDYE